MNLEPLNTTRFFCGGCGIAPASQSPCPVCSMIVAARPGFIEAVIAWVSNVWVRIRGGIGVIFAAEMVTNFGPVKGELVACPDVEVI